MKPPTRDADAAWMRRAITLARRGEGLTRPNPPVGAVVVADERIVGSGWHRRAGGAHAEAAALAAAGAHARGATLYVTLEPCCTRGRTPPCTDAIAAAGIRRVVVGMRDPNPAHNGRGLRKLRRGGVEIIEGVETGAVQSLMAPFACVQRNGRPLVTLKMGMTVDGRIADRRGVSQWITGPEARREVQRLRKRVDAVMVGGATVRRDNPSLLCRLRRQNQLARIVVDSAGRVDPAARVFTDTCRDRTLLATTARCPARVCERLERLGVRVLRLPEKAGHVSLRALMTRLRRLGLLHVLCEGGGTLAGALLGQGLIDAFVFFVAPRILGDGDTTAVFSARDWLLGRMPALRFTSCRRVGDDLMIVAEPAPRGTGGGA
jgi:diaminohydroxyphosphoribosylaminopyrimidine deaminase/5-amino-6-(5-phosphoribosylamino)uracil reductase